MALEINHLKKREDTHMKKVKLAARTLIHVDPKTGKERLATDKDKNDVFLLGAEGAEVDAERAEALGIGKPAKAAEGGKGEGAK
jgi:hypothetical protein